MARRPPTRCRRGTTRADSPAASRSHRRAHPRARSAPTRPVSCRLRSAEVNTVRQTGRGFAITSAREWSCASGTGKRPQARTRSLLSPSSSPPDTRIGPLLPSILREHFTKSLSSSNPRRSADEEDRVPCAARVGGNRGPMRVSGGVAGHETRDFVRACRRSLAP
jgi:hypothetical protein